MTRDRLAALLDPGSHRNGVDYVELLGGDPPQLAVHFLTAEPLNVATLNACIDGGDRIRAIPLDPIQAADLTADADGRPLLRLRARIAGDFTPYRLTVTAPELDPAFTTATVSFKAFCPTRFDCAPPPLDCPEDGVAVPPIDYLAKDFASFRRLLLDDSAQRYPEWLERSEADFGLMMAEALAALADELSYQQDRAAADLSFGTAVSRGALAGHARLVDYAPGPIRSARTELMLTVSGPVVTAGTRIDGTDADGQRIAFEVGEGLTGPAAYDVDPAANWPLAPWWWDDAQQCLPRGATQMWLEGDALGLVPGMRILIQTDLPQESIRQIVTLTEVAADFDPLFPPGTGTKLTRISWGAGDALLRDRDLARTSVGGNVVPATQGARFEEAFAIPPVPTIAAGLPAAFEREGADGRPVLRMPIAAAPLAWLAGADMPEMVLRQTAPDPRDWHAIATLLDADGLEPAFAVDPERWRVVMRRGDGTAQHWEPDGEDGATIRFGDTVFGAAPEPGALFRVIYRTSAGAAGNLPADAIHEVADAAGFVTGARNPLPASGGGPAETAAEVRRDAPQAFRAHPLRAVRAEDYVATARELPWVQDAGARFRWTGSWHSAFVAADPIGGFEIDDAQHLELQQLIDRRRLAGVEAFSPRPRFVSIDLEIEICVAASARRDDVERRVLEALAPTHRGARGFFFADHFTFGTPLYRARLEAAVMAVPGVKGVLAIRYRRRATLATFIALDPVLAVGKGEILRIDNDPDWPERGSIAIVTEGGQ